MTAALRRFVLPGYAASVVECCADELIDWQDYPNIAAVVEAFRAAGPYTTSDQPRAIVVPKSRALDIADGLCDLLNGEDDMADANARNNPELAAMNRAGARGLRTVRNKVLDFHAQS